MRDFLSLKEDIKKNMVEFMRVDLETAMTLVGIAADADTGSEKKERNIRNAHSAYETVRRMLTTVESTAEEREELDMKLSDLRNSLEQLGDTFD